MKYIFVWFAFVAILSSCSTQNPLCTDNYCVEGEVFPRSELGDRDYSELDIDDSQLLSIFSITPPVPTQPETTPDMPILNIIDTSVANIVSNTVADDNQYAGYIVSISATVEHLLTPTNDALTLNTDNDQVIFFVTSRDKPDLITQYNTGQTYDFTLFIAKQEPDSNTEGRKIITSYLTNTDVGAVTLSDLVSHAKTDNKEYQGNVVSIDVTVLNKTESIVFFHTNPINTMNTTYGPDDVIFGAIDATASTSEYEIGEAYKNIVLITVIGSDVINNGPGIVSYFIKTE